ncbi:MAG: MFS transporter [Beijerinckiaceae bacterium]
MKLPVIAIGVAQTLGYGSVYYLPAILMDGIAKDLGVSTPVAFGAFTLSLLILAFIGPWSGRWIDRHGGRGILCAASVLFAAGLALTGLSTNVFMLYAAWLLLGVGMGIGLYESAFATLAALFGRDARGAITGVTLIAGFASTVAWPLTAWMEAAWGWRTACFVWAALNLTLGLGMNLLVPAGTRESRGGGDQVAGEPPVAARDGPRERRIMLILSFAFGAGLFITTSMSAHLPRLLEQAGASAVAAVAAGALIGPAQVGARLIEYFFLQRVHPLFITRAAMATHPVAVAVLLVLGGPAAAVFVLIHAAGNGVQTIAKGTLPLALFGPQGYGLRQGLISAPGRVAQAFAPVLFGLLIERFGAHALWVTAAMGLAATASLWLLRPEHR